MKLSIVVIDGLGGRIGAQIVCSLREKAQDNIEIVALGTNATAVDRMIKAGADRGASGENAIIVSASLGSLIIGPIGIVIPNSMMGELSPAMAEAVMKADSKRILIPLQHDHFILVGSETVPVSKLIEEAVERALEEIRLILE